MLARTDELGEVLFFLPEAGEPNGLQESGRSRGGTKQRVGVFAPQRRREVTRTITVGHGDTPCSTRYKVLDLEDRSLRPLTNTAMPQHSPPTPIEEIITNHFRNDPKTLKQCSLISKSWAACAQKHLFNEIDFMSGSGLMQWKKSFPNPSNSPARHTKHLSINTVGKNRVGFIRSFTNVTH